MRQISLPKTAHLLVFGNLSFLHWLPKKRCGEFASIQLRKKMRLFRRQKMRRFRWTLARENGASFSFFHFFKSYGVFRKRCGRYRRRKILPKTAHLFFASKKMRHFRYTENGACFGHFFSVILVLWCPAKTAHLFKRCAEFAKSAKSEKKMRRFRAKKMRRFRGKRCAVFGREKGASFASKKMR